MAWFWDAVARGGEGISAEELAAHVISGGWSPHDGLDSPAPFAFSLRNGVFGGAALNEVARGADGLVRTSFQTPSGLRLEAHFVLDPDREHRIIPTPAERFMRYTVRGNTTFRKSPSEGKQSAGVGITTVGLRLEGGASMTAITVAALRAAHYVADEPKILADSLERVRGRTDRPSAGKPDGSAWSYQVAVRSRWAEDMVADAQTERVAQYVLLGAGLDSFAYRRRPKPNDGLRVFEVDAAPNF